MGLKGSWSYTCKGKCQEAIGFDARKNIHNFTERGFNKCRTCECHYNKAIIEYKTCPCCGSRLAYSTLSRRKSNQRKYEKIQKAKEQQELLRRQLLESLNEFQYK